MIYKIQEGDQLQKVAQHFGYTNYKLFFQTMRYLGDKHAWIPGAVIECPSDPRTSRDRPYDGQPHTDHGERGKTFVEGLTMRDINDCYLRAILRSSGDVDLNQLADGDNIDAVRQAIWHNIDFSKLDPIAVGQNLSCEIERAMGIFPNIPIVESTGSPTQQGGNEIE